MSLNYYDYDVNDMSATILLYFLKSKKGVVMTIKKAISQRILQLCREKNITVNKLSTLAGITQSTLNDIVYGKTNNPTVKTIYYVCFGLGIDLKEFFDSDLFKEISDN